MVYTQGLVRSAFGLFRTYIPASAMRVPAGYSQEDADSRFPGAQVFVYGGMIAIGTLFAWTTYEGLVHLNRHLSTIDGPAAYSIAPQGAIWWFLPAFGAVTLSWEIALQFWALAGSRSAADQFSYWTAHGTGFDCRRVLRWFVLVVVVPIAVLTCLALPMHTVLRADDIRDCGYGFGGCRVYRYADARRITEVDGFRLRDGTVSKRAGIAIDFADGRRWSSADEGDFHDSVDPGFERFLQEKTHQPLNHATTAADIPPF
jgi:hypothetical protein